MKQKLSRLLLIFVLSFGLSACSSLRKQTINDETFHDELLDSYYDYDDEERDWEYDFQD